MTVNSSVDPDLLRKERPARRKIDKMPEAKKVVDTWLDQRRSGSDVISVGELADRLRERGFNLCGATIRRYLRESYGPDWKHQRNGSTQAETGTPDPS